MNNYSLPAADSHFISLNRAIDMISFYRQSKEAILNPSYQNQNVLCNSETFVLADVQALLNQTGCSGLRIYYGMNPDYTVHAILVAVDETGKDIVNNTNKLNSTDDDPLILEEGKRCPPVCPDDSVFNL